MKQPRHAVALIVVLLAISLGVSAQESEADYKIGPKDVLEIRVLELPDMNVERRVADNGSIDLPLLGEFKVSGMTASEARNELETVLRQKYVNRANVSIVIKEYSNRPLSLVGAVAKPGTLNLSGRWTLLQALSAVGGVTQTAGKRIYILRRADNGLSDVLEVRLDDLLRDATSTWNVPVFPADVINVPARSTVKVFVIGEVKTPGAHEFDVDDRLSLLSVIAKAGGLSDRASKNIRIRRKGADGKDTETVVNYKAVLAGKAADPELRADDVVVVEESFF